MTDAWVRPQVRVLRPEQIEQVHAYALQVLSRTGVRVDSPRGRELFARRLGANWVEGERVRLPPEVVEWAIQAAPSTVELYDRRGQPAFCLGDGRTRFGIGVTSLYYQDPRTDALEPFARRHMRELVRLGHSLPLYDVVSTVGVLQDVPPDRADLYATLDMAANTTKPLVLLVSDDGLYPLALDLLEHLCGDLSERPFVLPYFNPVTPLLLNAGTVDKVVETVERGLPLIYSNYSMAGASTPLTPAGMLALLDAELLAGLVLAQLVREGTPVVLGMLPAFFDLKTMVNFYDPQSLLLNLACAELMTHYRLPHCGSSGSGTGWGMDLLAAETYWLNHLTSCLGKVGLCPFIGDTLTSKAFTPNTVVYVHEILEQALRFARGFSLDEGAAVLDEINQVGPGGNFLTAPSTLRLMRQAYYSSAIFPRWSLERWRDEGRPRADSLLREYTVALLAGLEPPPDHGELLERGEAFIRRL
ncbi:MAG: trimethylamine methyltransferase family protein [Chloroflexia bacterium]|nr:trimethylamine methyltransferase family protein [Chloroflexia bacterium]